MSEKLYRVKPGYDVSRPVTLAALRECLEEVEVLEAGPVCPDCYSSVCDEHDDDSLWIEAAIVRIPEDNE